MPYSEKRHIYKDNEDDNVKGIRGIKGGGVRSPVSAKPHIDPLPPQTAGF